MVAALDGAANAAGIVVVVVVEALIVEELTHFDEEIAAVIRCLFDLDALQDTSSSDWPIDLVVGY